MIWIAAGLMQPWSGVVAVDGQPIGSLPVGQLTQAVSRVDQTILLMAGTVRENISLWDATVSDSAILRALSDAAIVDDVLARPGGLDAWVLEGGRNFSGGQRQRLEIARALVRITLVLKGGPGGKPIKLEEKIPVPILDPLTFAIPK